MTEPVNVTSSYGKALNAHGYPFQHAIVRAFRDLAQAGKSKLRFVAVELPVEVQGRTTHIDIVLRHQQRAEYYVVECKRSNPAFLWSFARSPLVKPGHQEHFFAEAISKRGDTRHWTRGIKRFSLAGEPAFHISFESKSGQKGDAAPAKNEGRGAVESAATQVSRGANGLLGYLERHPQLLQKPRGFSIIPIVVTTSNLVTSDADLSLTDLDTGLLKVPEESISTPERVLFQYHQSQHLKAELNLDPEMKTLREVGEFLEFESIRSIVFVRPSGLESTVNWLEDTLDDPR